jgi:glycosyltransferase involved in cell wall biosynthesis
LASPAMHYCFLTVSTLDSANLMRAREMGRALIKQGVRVSYIVEDQPVNRAFKDLDPKAEVKYVTDPRKLGQFGRRRKLLKQLRPDFVEVLNPHPKTLLPIWWPIAGTKIVAMWDEPMVLKPLGVIKRIYEERLAQSLIHRADYHFAATEKLRQKLQKRYGIDAIYMPHAAYLPQYPQVTSPFDQPTAVYMGNLYPLFDHDVIFDAARLLAQEGKQPAIVVIGQGPEQEKWQRFIAEHRLDNVKLLGYMSGVELWGRLRHAQVLLFPIRDTLANLTRCPSKTFAYAQARRPTITNRVGEVARVLGDNATYIECTPEAFARAIAQAMSGPLGDVDYQVERENWDDRAATLIRALSGH